MDRRRLLGKRIGTACPNGRPTWTRLVCLLVAAVSLGACGCAPIVGTLVLMKGFKTIPPEFGALKGDRVVVICTADFPVQLEFPEIDTELGRHLGERFRRENIKAVRQGEVAEWLDVHPDQLDTLSDYRTIEEIAGHFEADYVLVVNLKSFSLYEEGWQTLYRGRALASMEVYDLEQGERVWSTEHQTTYPIHRVVTEDEMPESIFRVEFLKQLSQELGRYFYAHEPGEDVLAS